MSSELLALLQRQMMEVIAAHAYYVRDSIGKEALDQRVLDVVAAAARAAAAPVAGAEPAAPLAPFLRG